MKIARMRQRRQRRMAHDDRVGAPDDQHDHHHGDQLHDVQGFFAGFGNALGVFPPEVNGDDNGKAGGDQC